MKGWGGNVGGGEGPTTGRRKTLNELTNDIVSGDSGTVETSPLLCLCYPLLFVHGNTKYTSLFM